MIKYGLTSKDYKKPGLLKRLNNAADARITQQVMEDNIMRAIQGHTEPLEGFLSQQGVETGVREKIRDKIASVREQLSKEVPASNDQLVAMMKDGDMGHFIYAILELANPAHLPTIPRDNEERKRIGRQMTAKSFGFFIGIGALTAEFYSLIHGHGSGGIWLSMAMSATAASIAAIPVNILHRKMARIQRITEPAKKDIIDAIHNSEVEVPGLPEHS